MKKIQRVIALVLALLMVSVVFSAVIMNAKAIEQGGFKQTEDYTIGVDLSIWNVGGSKVLDYTAVDFAKMKADGCDFAIVRLGFEGSSTGEDTLDLAFIEYYNRAREAGMKLGVYFFSRATSYEAAKQDAEWVINVIEENDMYFEYPICYDVEADVHYAMGADVLNQVCYGWCETMDANGYFPAVYLNKQLYPKLTADFKASYDVWYRYIHSDGEFDIQYDPATLNISDQCSLWQYTMYQRFDGCSYKYTGKNQIDGNVSYKDYAAIMEANGYNNWEVKPEEEPEISSGPESSAVVSEENSVHTASENQDSDGQRDPSSLGIWLIVGGVVIFAAIIIIVLVFVKKKQ